MSDWDKGPSTYVDKYRRFFGVLMAIISISISLVFIDIWILPSHKVNTEIEYGTHYYDKHGQMRFGKYETTEGITFVVEKDKDRWYGDVYLEYSPFLKMVITVSYKGLDYSHQLELGLHNVKLLFVIILFLITTSGAILLLSKAFITENAFINFVLGTLFMLFIFGISISVMR